MPAQLGSGPILGNDRVLDARGWNASPAGDRRSKRMEKLRNRRSRVQGVVSEIVPAAIADDPPLGLPFAIYNLLE